MERDTNWGSDGSALFRLELDPSVDPTGGGVG